MQIIEIVVPIEIRLEIVDISTIVIMIITRIVATLEITKLEMLEVMIMQMMKKQE